MQKIRVIFPLRTVKISFMESFIVASISTSQAMNSTSLDSDFVCSAECFTASKLLYEILIFDRNNSILFK